MGCEILVAGGSRRAFDAIVALFEERDRVFSRFRADSELTRVNAMRSSVVTVSPLFARAAREAVAAAQATGGLVDPTLGAALEAAGYDVDFAQLVADPAPAGPPATTARHALAVGDGILRRPIGTRLDLNGVVKGMTVDDAVALLDGPGFVSAGGDLAARGMPVTVGLPDGALVALAAGGIATSGSTKRRWLRGGEAQHHLIDPATGAPARSPWAWVTAVGRSCLAADVAAKAGFLRGADGPAWLDRRGVAARFGAAEGGVVENLGWSRSLGREPAWA
jgi:thiamine biosynthesis lipoprotein